jgi:hypothetical protein
LAAQETISQNKNLQLSFWQALNNLVEWAIALHGKLTCFSRLLINIHLLFYFIIVTSKRMISLRNDFLCPGSDKNRKFYQYLK